MVYFLRLSKSGNSLVVALPAPVRDALRLGPGDQLALTIEGERILIVKMDDRRSAEILAELKGAKA